MTLADYEGGALVATEILQKRMLEGSGIEPPWETARCPAL